MVTRLSPELLHEIGHAVHAFEAASFLIYTHRNAPDLLLMSHVREKGTDSERQAAQSAFRSIVLDRLKQTQGRDAAVEIVGAASPNGLRYCLVLFVEHHSLVYAAATFIVRATDLSAAKTALHDARTRLDSALRADLP